MIIIAGLDFSYRFSLLSLQLEAVEGSLIAGFLYSR